MLKSLPLPCAVCGDTRMHAQDVPNHVLHAVLTVVTGGLWAIPWLIWASQDKPASCTSCGTLRSGKVQLLLGPASGGPAMTDKQLEGALDLALTKVKGPLRTCRTKHGIIGEVTYRLRYEASGMISGVTIDNGPPNITPGFINDSATIIKGMLVLPPTMSGGVMHFTDLDTGGTEPYR
ncbi:MAG: hypothetical protein KF773_25820 [Deltaproteobacteria bacterium]|nr:hypothetical protein [Deltaproteobacteria bacterium]